MQRTPWAIPPVQALPLSFSWLTYVSISRAPLPIHRSAHQSPHPRAWIDYYWAVCRFFTHPSYLHL